MEIDPNHAIAEQFAIEIKRLSLGDNEILFIGVPQDMTVDEMDRLNRYLRIFLEDSPEPVMQRLAKRFLIWHSNGGFDLRIVKDTSLSQ